MVRNRFKLIVLAVALLIVLTGCTSLDKDSFNEENAYKHILELSSDKYEGRLPGTEGNEKAALYIQEEFRKIGLKPYMDNGSYFQQFECISPILNTPAKFEVLDDEDRVIKKYSLRKDFAESPRDYSMGGQADCKLKIFNSIDGLNEGDEGLLLINSDEYTLENCKAFIDKGIKVVIRQTKYEPRGNNKDLLVKSTYIGEK